jgi:transcriptional regulator with XRE-family HTH domain
VTAIDPKAFAKAMDMAGISPRQLADRAEISADYVLNIRNGHRRLKRNPVLRRRLAEELGVPPRWIETEEVA